MTSRVLGVWRREMGGGKLWFQDIQIGFCIALAGVWRCCKSQLGFDDGVIILFFVGGILGRLGGLRQRPFVAPLHVLFEVGGGEWNHCTPCDDCNSVLQHGVVYCKVLYLRAWRAVAPPVHIVQVRN